MNQIKWFVLMIVLGGFGYGEIRTITLSNALSLAMANNTKVLQSEKELKIAEDQYSGSIADFLLPSVNLSGNATYLDPGTVSNSEIKLPMPLAFYVKPGVVVPYAIDVQTAYTDNYSASLSVSKPLFDGFRNQNSMEIKKLGYELAKAKYEDIKRQVASSTVTSFYNLFLLEENINLTDHLNKNLKDRLDYTKENFKAGLTSQFDMIRAEVAYKHNQPLLMKMNNNYASAKMAFCDSIGVDEYSNVEFIGNLTDSTNMQAGLTEDEAIGMALSNDVRMKTMSYNIKSLKLSRDIAASTGYPVVTAFFNDKYNYGMESFLSTNRSWYNSWNAGIQVNIPLDNLLPVSKAAFNADAIDQNMKETILAQRQLNDEIVLQVRTLKMQIDQAKESIDSQFDTLNQAKLGLEIANNRYKQGTSSLLDVTDAEVSYTQSQVAYLQAIYDYFSSVVQLKRLTGSAL